MRNAGKEADQRAKKKKKKEAEKAETFSSLPPPRVSPVWLSLSLFFNPFLRFLSFTLSPRALFISSLSLSL